MANRPFKIPKDTKGNEYFPVTTTDAIIYSDNGEKKVLTEVIKKDLKDLNSLIIDEENRVLKENERKADEILRSEEEDLRKQNEEDRKANELTRQNSFSSNEAARQKTFNDNESARQNTFIKAESQRETAETIRQEEELKRQEAETTRQENYDKKVDRTDNAPELTAGFAGNLVGRGESTSEEIGFRPSGGLTSVNDGAARIERLKGNTLVWNQLRDNIDGMASNGVSYSEDNKGVITASGVLTNSYASISKNISTKGRIGHKLLLIDENIGNTDVQIRVSDGVFSLPIGTLIDTGRGAFNLYFYGEVGREISFSRKIFIYDLTQMFGAGNEPTTIEEFNARKPLGIDEYAYNEGELISTTADEIKSVGFNAWDEEWEVGAISGIDGTDQGSLNQIRNIGYIRIAPSSTYEILCKSSKTQGFIVVGYDEDFRYTGWLRYSGDSGAFTTRENDRYIRFCTYNEGYGTTYNHDICIHLVHTGYRNGEYEPYEEFRRSLPISEIKDSEGNALFPNGLLSAGSVYDEITATKAIKRIGMVDMGTLNWHITGKETVLINNIGVAKSVNENKSLLCSAYVTHRPAELYGTDKSGIAGPQAGYWNTICVYNSSYTDDATFKAAMQGVMLYYELAEPIEVDLPEPINMDYEVSDFGTEEVISDIPTTPLKADIIYQFNAVDRIRENSLSIGRLSAIEQQAVVKNDIVNNLTDGGADKALSAEMGKELKGEVAELKKELVISPEYHTYSGKITDGVISSSDNIFYVWSGYYCMLINTSVLTPKIRISNIADKNITVCFIEGLPKHSDLVKYVGEKLSLAPSKSIELEVPVGAKSLYVNNGTTTEAMSKIELLYNEGEKIDFTLEDGFITGDNYYRKYDFPVKSAIVEVQHGDTYKITSAIETDISLLKERPVLDGDVVVYSDFAPSKFKSNDTIISVPEDAKYMVIRVIDVDGTDKGVEIKKCSFESKQFIKELNEKIEQSLHFISSLDARQTTTETDVESVKAELADVSESVKKTIVSREVDKELSSIRGVITSDGTWFYPAYENYRCLMLPTYGIYKIRISTKDTGTRYAFVKKELGSINEVPQFAEGTKPISISDNQDLILDIPSEGKFLYVLLTDKSAAYIDGLDIEIMVIKGNYAKHEIYIAAENSSEIDKANADVICDGIHDEVEIQDAIDLMKKVCGKVILYQGDYYVDSIPEHVIDGKPQKVALCMLTEKSNEKYGVIIEGMTSGRSSYPVIHINETAFANTTDEHTVFGGGCSEATNYLGGIGMIIRNIQCIVPFGYKCVVSNNQYFYWGMVENCKFLVEGYKDKLAYTEGSVGLRGWNGFTDGTVVGAKDVYVFGFHVGFQMGGEHVICERLGARYDGIGYTFGEYDMNYHGTDPSLAIGQIHPITMINCCAEFTDDLIKFYGSGSAENKGAYRCEVSFISFNVELSSFTMGYDLSRGASEVVEGGWVGRIDYTVSNGTTTNYVDKPFWADGHGKNFRTTNLAQQQMGNTALRNTFAPNYCQQYFDTDLQKIVYCVEPSTKIWVDANGNAV